MPKLDIWGNWKNTKIGYLAKLDNAEIGDLANLDNNKIGYLAKLEECQNWRFGEIGRIPKLEIWRNLIKPKLEILEKIAPLAVC